MPRLLSPVFCLVILGTLGTCTPCQVFANEIDKLDLLSTVLDGVPKEKVIDLEKIERKEKVEREKSRAKAREEALSKAREIQKERALRELREQQLNLASPQFPQQLGAYPTPKELRVIDTYLLHYDYRPSDLLYREPVSPGYGYGSGNSRQQLYGNSGPANGSLGPGTQHQLLKFEYESNGKRLYSLVPPTQSFGIGGTNPKNQNQVPEYRGPQYLGPIPAK